MDVGLDESNTLLLKIMEALKIKVVDEEKRLAVLERERDCLELLVHEQKQHESLRNREQESLGKPSFNVETIILNIPDDRTNKTQRVNRLEIPPHRYSEEQNYNLPKKVSPTIRRLIFE